MTLWKIKVARELKTPESWSKVIFIELCSCIFSGCKICYVQEYGGFFYINTSMFLFIYSYNYDTFMLQFDMHREAVRVLEPLSKCGNVIFNFHITNFPFLSSNIPSSPAYGVFISLLIRYVRACSSYECFILRAVQISIKLLGQGYVKERLKSSLRNFYGRYGDLTKQYEVPSPACYTTYSDTLHW